MYLCHKACTVIPWIWSHDEQKSGPCHAPEPPPRRSDPFFRDTTRETAHGVRHRVLATMGLLAPRRPRSALSRNREPLGTKRAASSEPRSSSAPPYKRSPIPPAWSELHLNSWHWRGSASAGAPNGHCGLPPHRALSANGSPWSLFMQKKRLRRTQGRSERFLHLSRAAASPVPSPVSMWACRDEGSGGSGDRFRGGPVGADVGYLAICAAIMDAMGLTEGCMLGLRGLRALWGRSSASAGRKRHLRWELMTQGRRGFMPALHLTC